MKKEGSCQKKRLGIFDYIKKCDNTDLGLGGLDFSLEAFENSRIVLYGCRRIIKYTFSEMILETRKFNVCIYGSTLNCSAYHVHGVEISGEIDNIKFEKR